MSTSERTYRMDIIARGEFHRKTPVGRSSSPRDLGARPIETGAGVVETHISMLFFVGDRVFKLHKPVRFGFLDFTDRMARQEDCQREVDLNRRLAPDVYPGVADLTMDGVPLDHMVVMRALPADRRLSALVSSGADMGTWLDCIAARLASFHADADRYCSQPSSFDYSGRACDQTLELRFRKYSSGSGAEDR